MSTQRLEDILLDLTTLRLDKLFFPWTSNAYKGLKEPSLTTGRDAYGNILVSGLVNKLKSSPGLQQLEVGLAITRSLCPGVMVEPIALEDLATLKFIVKHGVRAGTLSRWIAPGSKHLQLSLVRNYFTFCASNEDLFKDDGFIQFRSRSIVPMITAPGLQGINQVADLLNAGSDAQTLVFADFSSEQDLYYRNFPGSATSLQSLCALRSEICAKDL